MSLFSAAILAGGQGRRLGGCDKSSLVVQGTAVLARQLDLLRPLTPHVLIVGGKPALQETGARVVPDAVSGGGALGGLYTALLEAPTDQVLVLACDMPFVTTAFLAHVAGAGQRADAAVPRDALGLHSLCASYHRRIAPVLRAQLDRGALRIAEALTAIEVAEVGPDEIARFNHDGRLLLNINTPDDYARAAAPGLEA